MCIYNLTHKNWGWLHKYTTRNSRAWPGADYSISWCSWCCACDTKREARKNVATNTEKRVRMRVTASESGECWAKKHFCILVISCVISVYAMTKPWNHVGDGNTHLRTEQFFFTCVLCPQTNILCLPWNRAEPASPGPPCVRSRLFGIMCRQSQVFISSSSALTRAIFPWIFSWLTSGTSAQKGTALMSCQTNDAIAIRQTLNYY